MSKSRSRAADFAVYLAVRLFVCLVQSLSWSAAGLLARGLAVLAYRFDRRHRQAADDNLRHAFPGRFDDQQRDRMVRAVFRHFCTLLIEIILLPRKLRLTNWRYHVDLTDGKQFLDLLFAGQPMLMVTGHFGNWELGGYAIGLLGFRTYAVARPLDNPFLDQFLRRFREATGQRVLAKHGDFDKIQAVLKAGGILATLADQDAGQRGLFVDFFGRPASTHKAIALLSLQYRVPLVVLGVRKVGEPARYRLQVADVIYPDRFASRSDAVKTMTQRFTTALEGLVRQAPEQYFWLHRRWKHQPAARKGKRAA